MKIHKNFSIDLVRNEHPFWNQKMIELEASKRFEKSARLFMEETLKLAKKTRKQADWGYYGYPYCFNMSPNNPVPDCDATAMRENDKYEIRNIIRISLFITIRSINDYNFIKLISLIFFSFYFFFIEHTVRQIFCL